MRDSKCSDMHILLAERVCMAHRGRLFIRASSLDIGSSLFSLELVYNTF